MMPEIHEKLPLPKHYDLFWKAYQESFPSGEGTLGTMVKKPLTEEDKGYIARRAQEVLPNSGKVVGANPKELMLERKLELLPIIYDNDPVADKRETKYLSGKYNVMIGITPSVATILNNKEICQLRLLKPELEVLPDFDRLVEVGNPDLAGILFSLCSSAFQQNKPNGLREWKVYGNTWHSTPAEYPVEKYIADIYTRVKPENFARKAKAFFEFRKLLREAQTPEDLRPLIEGRWPGMKGDLYNVIRKE